MTGKSSAYKVQYDIRPSKQSERRILLDVLKAATEAGLNLSSYQYVGFGGFKFYDFEMLFRHLGIRDMVSIEGDKSLFPRSCFNKPFSFIKMEGCYLGAYVERAVFKKPLVAWLDYDSGLSRDVVDDVLTLGTKVPVGSFIFVTIDGRMSRGMASVSSAQRVADLTEEYLGFAQIQDASEVEASEFHKFSERVLWAALNKALSSRLDGKFVPVMRVFYSDTAQMLTVGGCLVKEGSAPKLSKILKQNFPFLLPRPHRSPYGIPNFNFTAKERLILDLIVTSSRNKADQRQLEALGIRKTVIREYKRMVRFIPKYFESYI